MGEKDKHGEINSEEDKHGRQDKKMTNIEKTSIK